MTREEAERLYYMFKERAEEAEAEIARLRAENQMAWNKADELDERARHAEAALRRALADNERLTANCKGWYDQNVNLIEQRDKVWEENKSLRSDNERLRALLLRHQVAAWCEEDSDLAVETRAAIGELHS